MFEATIHDRMEQFRFKKEVFETASVNGHVGTSDRSTRFAGWTSVLSRRCSTIAIGWSTFASWLLWRIIGFIVIEKFLFVCHFVLLRIWNWILIEWTSCYFDQAYLEGKERKPSIDAIQIFGCMFSHVYINIVSFPLNKESRKKTNGEATETKSAKRERETEREENIVIRVLSLKKTRGEGGRRRRRIHLHEKRTEENIYIYSLLFLIHTNA